MLCGQQTPETVGQAGTESRAGQSGGPGVGRSLWPKRNRLARVLWHNHNSSRRPRVGSGDRESPRDSRPKSVLVSSRRPVKAASMYSAPRHDQWSSELLVGATTSGFDSGTCRRSSQLRDRTFRPSGRLGIAAVGRQHSHRPAGPADGPAVGMSTALVWSEQAAGSRSCSSRSELVNPNCRTASAVTRQPNHPCAPWVTMQRAKLPSERRLAAG